MREIAGTDRKSKPAQDIMQQLVYGISHDMGAPLRAVVQFSQLLEKRLTERLDDKERYWLQLIQQSGEKGQEMLEGLLCYSRLVADASKTSRFSLNELVQSVIDTQIGHCASEKTTHTQPPMVTMTSALPDFEGIADYWRLFFSCVINNSLTYQPKNNKNHIPTVQIGYQLADGENRLQIDDNGIGVSKANRGNISRPFMQAHSTEEFPGIGMGLSYCDRIAQLHGGRLHFTESELGGLRVIYSYSNR